MQCNIIVKLQKKALRTVSVCSYNAHIEPLFKNLRLLKIKDMLTLQTLEMYHKFQNNNLPVYIQNWSFRQNNDIHHHNTRRANALHVNRYFHAFAQKSLKYNIVHVVNNTPQIILEKVHTHIGLKGFEAM